MDELNDQESAFARLLSEIPGDDQGRAEHREALRTGALAAFDAANRHQNAPVAWHRIASRGRELMRRPLPRLVLAAAACLSIVAGWLLVPGQLSTAQAFGMFADAIVEAKSATFQLDLDITGQGKQKLQSYYLASGKMRSEMPGVVSIADLTTGKTLNLLPEQKTALVITVKNMPSEPGRPHFDDFFEELRDLLSKRRDAMDEGVKQLGEKEIDGRRAIGFRCDSPVATVTLWGDPATGLPVQVESVSIGIPRIECTMSRFFFNGHLDPALFDTTPPADYKVQAFDLDVSKPTEVALIEGLRVGADLNDGVFADDLDSANGYLLLVPPPKQAIGDKQDNKRDMTPEFITIGRGMTFAAELPESADAHYAGKGVKLGEPNRPIFWYKPEAATTYRVIYADLSVKDAERAPEVAAGLLATSQHSMFQAFNMFAEALAEAKSATFQLDYRIEEWPNVESKGYYLAPGKLRVEAKDAEVDITDWNAGRCIFLHPRQKTATVMNLKNAPARPQLAFDKMRDLLAESLDSNEDHFERLGEKEIDGRRAVGFRYSSPLKLLTLWGDPSTGLPVLVDVAWTVPRSETMTMSHVVLNDKLDPALFDTTPPANYKVQAFDLDMSILTEATLVEGMRLAADLNDGQFLSKLDTASMQALFAKDAATDKKDKSNDAPADNFNKLEMLAWTVGRGLTFASELPEAAEAHYAGKGVKLGEPDRPIFWYKPEGAKNYRVIYADLSVKDAETAPQIAGAVRLEKTKPAEKLDEKQKK